MISQELGLDAAATVHLINAALRADGLSTLLNSVLNSFPYTCFAQNVGLVRLGRAKPRWWLPWPGRSWSWWTRWFRVRTATGRIWTRPPWPWGH